MLIMKLKINPSAPQRQGARVFIPRGCPRGLGSGLPLCRLEADHPPHPHPQLHTVLSPIQPPGPDSMKSQLRRTEAAGNPQSQRIYSCRASQHQLRSSFLGQLFKQRRGRDVAHFFLSVAHDPTLVCLSHTCVPH